jgi:heme-degrading monooxygenase HmoA
MFSTDYAPMFRRNTRKEMPMTVKIFIKRKVSPENILPLTVLLKKLRSLTLNQSGYIYGETLKRVDDKDECMVISTWRSMEDWKAWLHNEERIAIQKEIDQLLGAETEYAAYEV